MANIPSLADTLKALQDNDIKINKRIDDLKLQVTVLQDSLTIINPILLSLQDRVSTLEKLPPSKIDLSAVITKTAVNAIALTQQAVMNAVVAANPLLDTTQVNIQNFKTLLLAGSMDIVVNANSTKYNASSVHITFGLL